MSTGFEIYAKDDVLDAMSDVELVAAVEELRMENWQLTLENDCFEKFLKRVEPTLYEGLQKYINSANRRLSVLPTSRESTSRMSYKNNDANSTVSDSQMLSSTRRKSSSHRSDSISFRMSTTLSLSISLLDRGPRINVSQKGEIVDKETEDLRVVKAELLAKSENRKASLIAQTEEIDIRTAEIRESREQFEKTVVIDGVDPLTQRIPAEKFIHYMEEWLKNVASVIEKLRLRTGTMRSQYTRLHHQFALKAELSESLCPIDFEQLTIENQDHMATIEEKNTHLLGLKKVSGIASLTLSVQKKNLIEALKSLKSLNETIENTKKLILEMETEECKAEKEVEAAEEEYRKLKAITDQYSAPGVLEYVKKKAELYKLEDQIKIWTRKRSVQKIALDSCARQIK